MKSALEQDTNSITNMTAQNLDLRKLGPVLVFLRNVCLHLKKLHEDPQQRSLLPWGRIATMAEMQKMVNVRDSDGIERLSQRKMICIKDAWGFAYSPVWNNNFLRHITKSSRVQDAKLATSFNLGIQYDPPEEEPKKRKAASKGARSKNSGEQDLSAKICCTGSG